MKLYQLFLTLILLGGCTSCFAADSVSDAEFFDFISSDPKAPRVAAPEIKTPSEADAMLQKWKNYELEQTEKRNQAVQAARNTAVEMLLKKALAASPDTRGRILAEADRIKALPSEKPLLYTEGQPVDKLNALVGRWQIKGSPSIHEFNASGAVTCKEWERSAPMPWSWVDSAAGVVVSGKDFGVIYWLQKPGVVLSISTDLFRCTFQKLTQTAVSSFDPISVNLNISEETENRALNEKLEAQRQKVIKWLLDKGKKMSTEEGLQVVTNVHKMELESDEKSGNASKLSGLWHWERLEVLFQPHGIVAQKDGKKRFSTEFHGLTSRIVVGV